MSQLMKMQFQRKENEKEINHETEKNVSKQKATSPLGKDTKNQKEKAQKVVFQLDSILWLQPYERLTD